MKTNILHPYTDLRKVGSTWLVRWTNLLQIILFNQLHISHICWYIATWSLIEISPTHKWKIQKTRNCKNHYYDNSVQIHFWSLKFCWLSLSVHKFIKICWILTLFDFWTFLEIWIFSLFECYLKFHKKLPTF